MVFILSVFIGITLDLAGAKPAVNYYATKYNHIDVEAILNNRRLVNYYSACLLSKGPCPPEGIEFKRILPEALRSNCGRCTEKQSTVALRAIKRLKKEYPKIWSQLSAQWDPDDIYVRKFESSFANKNGSPNPLQSGVHRIDPGSGQPTDNTLDGIVSPTITASKLYSSTINQQDSTTHKVITSTNSISPSSLSTKETPPSPPTTPRTRVTLSATSSSRLFSSTSATTTRRTTSSTITRRTTTRRPQPIPGLLPLNTFFTNPPIPIRPIANLNIGANIGATVSGLVRGLGAIGTRVMETGAEIADVVIKNFARPLSL